MKKRPDENEIIEASQTFYRLLECMSEKRKKDVERMMEGPAKGYFTAPASSREEYHNCFPGGLLLHSLNVVGNLNRLAKALVNPGKFSAESLVFVGLFHDLGKVGDGEQDYYIPHHSDWHRKQGMLFEINKLCVNMPTSERGLYILQKSGIELTSDEYLAIRLNDGMYVDENKPYRMHEPELALLVHWADRWSAEQEKIT